MQNNQNVKRSLVALSSSMKTVKSRKTVIIFLLIGCFILYLASSYLLPAHRQFHASQLRESLTVEKTCLDLHLVKWIKMMEVNDAVIKKIPGSSTENRFYPFTGNGKVGFGMEKEVMKFYLLTKDHGNVASYLPVLKMKIKEKHSQEEKAIVLNLKSGIVTIVTTYDVEQSCVLVEETFYVHRKHDGLFHHEIEVNNKGLFPIEVSFKRTDIDKEMHSSMDGSSQQMESISGEIPVKKQGESQKAGVVKFTTVLSDFKPGIKVPREDKHKNGMTSLTQHWFVEKKKKTKSKRREISIQKDPTKMPDGDLKGLMKTNLQKDHLDSWNEIWKVGVTISSEVDPNSPSPLNANLTEYYMYSTTVYNASDAKPLSCFTGPSTIHTAAHWVMPTSLSSLFTLKKLWEDFFRANGCASSYISSLSMRELMVLSIIGLQFQKKRLQMALNPLNLRTNITVRHISLDAFHSEDWFDLKVVITNHKTEPLRVYVSNNGKHLPKVFGCASACEHVVELGSSLLKFAVHPTDPVTPLFYISTNRTHLEEINKAEFMKKAMHSAKENKANPHQMKLSPTFWISVVVLIVSFHVVILKMIYNECRKSRTSGGGRRNPFIN